MLFLTTSVAIVADVGFVTMVSLGGKAGRDGNESLLTGRTGCWACLVESMAGGGSGRAFEKRERPGLRSPTSEEAPILDWITRLCCAARGPFS